MSILAALQAQFPAQKEQWSAWVAFLRDDHISTLVDLQKLTEEDFNSLLGKCPTMLRTVLRKLRPIDLVLQEAKEAKVDKLDGVVSFLEALQKVSPSASPGQKERWSAWDALMRAEDIFSVADLQSLAADDFDALLGKCPSMLRSALRTLRQPAGLLSENGAASGVVSLLEALHNAWPLASSDQKERWSSWEALLKQEDIFSLADLQSLAGPDFDLLLGKCPATLRTALRGLRQPVGLLLSGHTAEAVTSGVGTLLEALKVVSPEQKDRWTTWAVHLQAEGIVSVEDLQGVNVEDFEALLDKCPASLKTSLRALRKSGTLAVGVGVTIMSGPAILPGQEKTPKGQAIAGASAVAPVIAEQYPQYYRNFTIAVLLGVLAVLCYVLYEHFNHRFRVFILLTNGDNATKYYIRDRSILLPQSFVLPPPEAECFDTIPDDPPNSCMRTPDVAKDFLWASLALFASLLIMMLVSTITRCPDESATAPTKTPEKPEAKEEEEDTDPSASALEVDSGEEKPSRRYGAFLSLISSVKDFNSWSQILHNLHESVAEHQTKVLILFSYSLFSLLPYANITAKEGDVVVYLTATNHNNIISPYNLNLGFLIMTVSVFGVFILVHGCEICLKKHPRCCCCDENKIGKLQDWMVPFVFVVSWLVGTSIISMLYILQILNAFNLTPQDPLDASFSVSGEHTALVVLTVVAVICFVYLPNEKPPPAEDPEKKPLLNGGHAA